MRHRRPLLLCAMLVAATGCAGARPSPTPTAVAAASVAVSASPAPSATPTTADAGVEDAALATSDASLDARPPEAASPLATLFDGDPTGGPIRLVETRCGPGCLQYPAGWISTDDNGFVYAWLFRGEGKFTTAEVMRSPVPKLDAGALALRLRFAGGENVTWSTPVEATVGKDHAHALVAEGVGTSRGRKAHFWYAYVDLPKRKDLVIAYVVDGEPQTRTDEAIAVVKSVGLPDRHVTPVPHD